MLDWWLDLPAWCRYGVALVLLGAGAIVCMSGAYRPGAALVAGGVALFAVADLKL
ncbi:MAG TPA: hypothetical protein P5081_11670 [Phycisphaerae bacterium]|nr:hypothetical protein [Phycisphaerae bacterium]HRW53538.1 hypothetical protein [Phycisphaerae bacterium]